MESQPPLRLGHRDFDRFERVVQNFHARVADEGVEPAFLRALTALIPGDVAMVMLRPEADAIFYAPSEVRKMTPEAQTEDMFSHPCIMRRTRGAMVVLDHTSRSRWHRTACYQHSFRGLGVEDDLGIDVKLGPKAMAMSCVQRPWRRFTRTDQTLYTMLGPQLAIASRQAQAIAGARDLARAGIEQAMGGGVIFIDARGQVLGWSEETRLAVAKAFGLSSRAVRKLPAELAAWAALRGDVLAPIFCREGGGLRLEFHFIPDRSTGGGMIVLRKLGVAPAVRNPDLSVREREVAGWAAQGLRNAEIAVKLGIAPGTVRRHLENVYAKLEVRGRVEISTKLSAG